MHRSIDLEIICTNANYNIGIQMLRPFLAFKLRISDGDKILEHDFTGSNQIDLLKALSDASLALRARILRENCSKEIEANIGFINQKKE